jgi:hypothetical protein
MLALASEAEVSYARLRQLYEQLLSISERQLNCVQNQTEDEQFLEDFQAFSDEWSMVQAEIMAEEERILQWVSVEQRRSDLAPLVGSMIRRAHENLKQAEDHMSRIMKSTGTMIRSAQDHRHATKAYYAASYDDQTPMFFDEKK